LHIARATLFAICTITFLPSGTLFAQEQAKETTGIVYDLGEGITSPKSVYTPEPEYCEKARKKKINGTVLITMIVLPDGKVHDVKVTQGIFPCLNEESIAAVSKWKFEPATKNGNPVAVHFKTQVTFTLY